MGWPDAYDAYDGFAGRIQESGLKNALETTRENREQRRLNRGENAEFGEVTLARQRRVSGGNGQKKSQPDKGWDFEYWWCRGDWFRTNSLNA
jgi:hypothetical protein